jgi:hypothetical protein
MLKSPSEWYWEEEPEEPHVAVLEEPRAFQVLRPVCRIQNSSIVVEPRERL